MHEYSEGSRLTYRQDPLLMASCYTDICIRTSCTVLNDVDNIRTAHRAGHPCNRGVFQLSYAWELVAYHRSFNL